MNETDSDFDLFSYAESVREQQLAETEKERQQSAETAPEFEPEPELKPKPEPENAATAEEPEAAAPPVRSMARTKPP